MSMPDPSPLFSIITVVYNSAPLLEMTLKSVVEQTYPQVEYIVVDGASTDGSLALIQQYESELSHWISEPDEGLYHAMNKGLGLATGDFVWFINAGDTIPHRETLAQMAAKMKPDTDILYGEVMLVDDERRPLGTRSEGTTHQLPEKLKWQSMRYGMVVSHQGFLPKRVIAPTFIPNNLSADIDWVIECLKKSNNTTHTQLIVAHYLMGGLSRHRHRQSLKDRYRILRKHFGTIPNLLAHGWILVRAAWYKWIRKKKYV